MTYRLLDLSRRGLLALPFVVALVSVTSALAQDAYHAALTQRLATQYGLPAGTWVFTDTEAGNIARASSYGVGYSVRPIANQDFSQEIALEVAGPGTDPWDAGYVLGNATPVRRGDKVLFTFAIRSDDGPGEVSIFVERAGDYAKEYYATVRVDINWQVYYVAFEASVDDFTVDRLRFGLHLAHRAQDVRLGGVTAINYGSAVSLSQLPSDLRIDGYDGRASDAPWRAPAARRIDSLRKADLQLLARRPDGSAAPGVALAVRQLRHEFAFGTAINACRLDGNRCYSPTFQARLTDLDGRGHGFNWVVFENDLKWPSWEEEWLASNEEVVAAVAWLHERDIEIRGHNLLWPGVGNYPDDLRGREADTAYVLRRIREHIDRLATTPGLAGEIAEWDVINETVTNVTLEEAFRGQGRFTTGRELYAEVFELARAANPEAALYLNDYVTLSLDNGPDAAAYKALERNVSELLAAGAPVDGLGFQGHIGTNLNGIPSVLATFDDFYGTFGLDAKVTEFDIAPGVRDSVAAEYLGDFLTATFSHPSMTGFFFWNWWDTDTWQNPSANLFDAEWRRTPAGATFVDKVFREWWTGADLATDATGASAIRAFKGTYLVSYTCGGESRTDTLTLAEAMTHEIVCADFASPTSGPVARQGLRLSPNPTTGTFQVEHDLPGSPTLELRSVGGELLWRGRAADGARVVPPVLPKGVYQVSMTDDGRRASVQLVVH